MFTGEACVHVAVLGVQACLLQSIADCRIVDYLGKYGVILIIMFVIKIGKDLVSIL